MANIELSATVREKGGKGNARKMRAQKLIPGVLYGPTVEKPLNIAVDPIALRKALATPKKLNTILTLKLDRGGDRQVMLKDYQTDVIKHDLLHADFYEVRLDQPVKVRVPLAFVGIPAGAADGGVLQTLRRELELLALPNAIPDQIEVDVAPLKIGQSLHLKDLKLPEGVKVKSLVNYTIAGVAAPEAETARAEAAGPAAGAAAPAAGAAAPAADKGAAAAPAKKEEKKK